MTDDIQEKILKKLMQDREQDYGNYEHNFDMLAILFSVVLHDILKVDIKAHQAAQLMMALKLYRSTRKFKADNYDDLQVYARMAKQLHKNIVDKKVNHD